MGNTSSSSSRVHDESVDFGFLIPQGVYTGPRDWNQAIVTQLICARRLAPFYRPLEDYDDSWTDDQILAARKELPDSEGASESSARAEATSTASMSSRSGHPKRPNTLKEPSRPEAAIYRGATECPICFLYYPPNINHSRCCDQAICTECFVQIKRSEPTATHLVSEPAACPYCVQDNFGVVYTPPSWRAGIGSEGSPSRSDSPKHSYQSLDNAPPTHKRRQKSFSADSPEVVATDHIRPDWEAKLAAVRAAVTRRANRRIIMRQVGDRLIPVGVTSGRVHALSPEEAAAAAEAAEGSGSGGGGGGVSWRSRRRQQAGGNGLEQYLGQDLEEMMMMEAMRLSLIEHEAQQRKEAEEKKKKAKEKDKSGNGNTDNAASDPGASGSGSSEPSSSSAPNLNSIDLSSTPAPSSSTTTSHQKSNSLQVKKGSLTGSLFSRSRSPSPAPSSQPADRTGAQSSNPPPFSTLTAALSTTSTASAFLGGSSSSTPSEPVAGSSTQPVQIPTASVSSPASVTNPSTPKPQVQETPFPPPPPIVIASPPPPTTLTPTLSPTTETQPEFRSDSTPVLSRTSTLASNSSYEDLPSSPEEESPREPLIPKVHEPADGSSSEESASPQESPVDA